MRTKSVIGIAAFALMIGMFANSASKNGAPKDCSKSACTSQERVAWRDALEAKEREKARGLGMAWHSFQMKAGSGINEFTADVRQATRK